MAAIEVSGRTMACGEVPAWPAGVPLPVVGTLWFLAAFAVGVPLLAARLFRWETT